MMRRMLDGVITMVLVMVICCWPAALAAAVGIVIMVGRHLLHHL